MKYFLLAILVFTTGCGDLKKEIRRLQEERDNQQEQINAINVQLLALENTISLQISQIEQGQTTMQTSVNLLITQLAALQQNVQILDIVDPCGDGPGFDEVLLKTSEGYIAYFETGSKRFLSVLSNGSYRTTDQQGCNFSVSNGQIL